MLRVTRIALLLTAALGLPLFAQAEATSTPAVALQANDTQVMAARWVEQLVSNSRFHYSPHALDDTLSSAMFDAYLESLDGDKLFLLQSDVDKFGAWRLQLDDALGSNDLGPAFEMFNVYTQRVNERIAHQLAVLDGDWDFTVDESYHWDREDAAWAKDSAELDELWRLRVKNDILRLRLAGKEMDDIRKTLRKRYRNFAERMRELDSEDVFQTFMNAYAGAIEPHTSYMNPRTSENFNIAMSLSLEGIGAVLSRDDEEYTVIRSIVPGGPAGMSGQVKVGDRIAAVGQEEGPMVDVVGWRVDDVVKLIRGPKGSKVRLDVLPADAGLDGEHTLVSLSRDKIKLEEQAAKKVIVDIGEGEDAHRIGVILLPTFYQDFEGRRRDEPDYRSATRDVEKLLAEFKQEKVDGVIIDLRQNGGGSLDEAVELTGLFIDHGPVVQVRDAGRRIAVQSDTKAGVAWDGPMAVMVNRASASASEIFAGAIQDYGRGLIIGEPTFGKGTVQNLIDLDRFAPGSETQLGHLKMTVAQFFRVAGGSTQHKGVVPDIAFPVTLDASEYGESMYDNALPWAEIGKANYASVGNLSPLVPRLQAQHETRAASDQEFIWWTQDVADYRAQRDKKLISLNEATRRAERAENETKRKARAEARKALGKTEDEHLADNEDDGLQDDERDVTEDLNAADATPEIDTLMRESAHILVDAIELLKADKALAAQVYPKANGALAD